MIKCDLCGQKINADDLEWIAMGDKYCHTNCLVSRLAEVEKQRDEAESVIKNFLYNEFFTVGYLDVLRAKYPERSQNELSK